MVRIIEVNENVFASNDKAAELLRQRLRQSHTFMLNVMSSPGSGKTTLLSSVINRLKQRLRIAVMVVDIETDLDASKIAANTGVESIQIHNGGLCHIDATMVTESLIQSDLDLENIDLLILENIGNLVCPAEFDTGANLNMMLLSVPEGDDKPLKYPLMFEVCDLCVITKIDTKPIFSFDSEKVAEYIHNRNKDARIMEVSAKKDIGIEQLCDYLEALVRQQQ